VKSVTFYLERFQRYGVLKNVTFGAILYFMLCNIKTTASNHGYEKTSAVYEPISRGYSFLLNEKKKIKSNSAKQKSAKLNQYGIIKRAFESR